jgi:hypothetical protein
MQTLEREKTKVLDNPPAEFQIFTSKGEITGDKRQKAWEVFEGTIDKFLKDFDREDDDE